jgi:hypothetical protein
MMMIRTIIPALSLSFLTTVVVSQNPWSVPTIFDDVTEIIVYIGPSGGPRGYEAITGETSSVGVSWYLNGDLAPQMVMRRGTTYTFKVNGGNDPNDGGNYHAFYLTTSARGGYQQLRPSERWEETPLAGIENISGDGANVYGFEATGVAPICLYEETWSSAGNEWNPYGDWVSTLNKSCAADDWIMSRAATITFTPDETTPNKIYYQCVNHFYLGWEILVVDNANAPPPTDAPAPTDSPTDAPAPTDSPTASIDPPIAPTDPPTVVEFTAVPLGGPLAGGTMSFAVNEADPRAGG